MDKLCHRMKADFESLIFVIVSHDFHNLHTNSMLYNNMSMLLDNIFDYMIQSDILYTSATSDHNIHNYIENEFFARCIHN